ncbi:MAG TPA: redox-regulated ATPase YchF [Candidatus Brocadiia bacterium]|nr:redox-regulated ATPase YchF [Candidatus Brocadiia bacterium]
MKIGIIGLPQCGKTTVFDAITGAESQVGSFAGPGNFNLAVLKVPDARLDFLQELYDSRKYVQATIEFMDVAGAFAAPTDANAEPSSAIAALREADAIAVVLRSFKDESVPRPDGGIDPRRDLAKIHSELILTDLVGVEKRIEKLEKQVLRPTVRQKEDKAELELMRRFKETLDAERPLREAAMSDEESKKTRSFGFLTLKPELCIVNVGEDELGRDDWAAALGVPPERVVAMCGKVEMELRALSPEERAEFMADMGIKNFSSDKVVSKGYALLKLATFLTAGPTEVHAWTINEGDNAVTAAGKIHTDMARGFIRAEVVAYDDLKQHGSMKEARAHGRVRLEGRDYVMKDGDVVEFRFNV